MSWTVGLMVVGKYKGEGPPFLPPIDRRLNLLTPIEDRRLNCATPSAAPIAPILSNHVDLYGPRLHIVTFPPSIITLHIGHPRLTILHIGYIGGMRGIHDGITTFSTVPDIVFEFRHLRTPSLALHLLLLDYHAV